MEQRPTPSEDAKRSSVSSVGLPVPGWFTPTSATQVDASEPSTGDARKAEPAKPAKEVKTKDAVTSKDPYAISVIRPVKRCGIEIDDPAKDIDTLYRAGLVALLSISGLVLTAAQLVEVRDESGGAEPVNERHKAVLWTVTGLTVASLFACMEYHSAASPHLPDEEGEQVYALPTRKGRRWRPGIPLPRLKLYVGRFLRQLWRRDIGVVVPFFIEILALAPHPLPYRQRRHVSIWLLGFMFLRLVTLLRFLVLLLPTYRQRFDIFSQAHVRGRYAHIHVSWVRMLKFAFLQHCSVTVAVLTVGGLACFSLMENLAEDKAQPDAYASFTDSFWFMFITYTTIGYGDMFPITHLGRVVTVLGGCFGVIMASLIGGVFAQKMAPSEVDHEMVQWSEGRELVRYMEECQVQLLQLYARDRARAIRTGVLVYDGQGNLVSAAKGVDVLKCAPWISHVTKNAARKARSARLRAMEMTGDSVSGFAGALRDCQIFLSTAAEVAESTFKRLVGISRNIVTLQRAVFAELGRRSVRLCAAEQANVVNTENVHRCKIAAEETAEADAMLEIMYEAHADLVRQQVQAEDRRDTQRFWALLGATRARLLTELGAQRQRREADFARQMQVLSGERERRQREFDALLRCGEDDRRRWSAWRQDQSCLSAEQRAEDGRAAAQAHAALVSEHRRSMELLHAHARALREVAEANHEQQAADAEAMGRSLQGWAAESREMQGRQQRWLDGVLQEVRADTARVEGDIRQDVRGVMDSERFLARTNMEVREILRRLATAAPDAAVKQRVSSLVRSAPALLVQRLPARPRPFTVPLVQIGTDELRQKAHDLMQWAAAAGNAGVPLPAWHEVKAPKRMERHEAERFYRQYQEWAASLTAA